MFCTTNTVDASLRFAVIPQRRIVLEVGFSQPCGQAFNIYLYHIVYTEKGYCLQGELCPYSHGNDAVVMKDVAGLNIASSTANQPAPTPSIAAPIVATAPIQPIIPSMHG